MSYSGELREIQTLISMAREKADDLRNHCPHDRHILIERMYQDIITADLAVVKEINAEISRWYHHPLTGD